MPRNSDSISCESALCLSKTVPVQTRPRRCRATRRVALRPAARRAAQLIRCQLIHGRSRVSIMASGGGSLPARQAVFSVRSPARPCCYYGPDRQPNHVAPPAAEEHVHGAALCPTAEMPTGGGLLHDRQGRLLCTDQHQQRPVVRGGHRHRSQPSERQTTHGAAPSPCRRWYGGMSDGRVEPAHR